MKIYNIDGTEVNRTPWSTWEVSSQATDTRITLLVFKDILKTMLARLDDGLDHLEEGSPIDKYWENIKDIRNKAIELDRAIDPESLHNLQNEAYYFSKKRNSHFD